MTTEPYGAVVIGATGAVGGAIVRSLLGSAACTHVVAVSRRPFSGFEDAPGANKLRLDVVEYEALEESTLLAASDCPIAFCAVGVGQPRKVSEAVHRQVDVEYAGAFARGAARAGVHHVLLLSSVGANPDSSNRYLKVKGDAEVAVRQAGCARTSLFRPSLLVTPEIRYGLQDRITQAFFPWIAPVLPRRFGPIAVEDLGRAMVEHAERPGPAGLQIVEVPEARSLAKARAGS